MKAQYDLELQKICVLLLLQYLYNQQQKSIVNTVPVMSGIMGILTYCLSKPGCVPKPHSNHSGNSGDVKNAIPQLNSLVNDFSPGGGGGGGGGGVL